MKTAFLIALERGKWYAGSGWHYILFFAALLFVIAQSKKEKSSRWLAGYSIIFAVVYLCPISARIIMKYCVGWLVYWRMFWILPTSVIMAYAAAKVCTKGKGKFPGILCACALFLLIAVCGENPYIGADAAYTKAENMQKLPTDACQVCQVITEHRMEGETATAVMPDDLIGYVRQYDPSIRLVYGRRSKLKKRRRRIHRQMNRENPNFKRLIKMIRRSGANYLVYAANEVQNEEIESYEFEQIGMVGGYRVYKDKNTAKM